MVSLTHASPYLDIFGDMIVGHFLLQGASIAREKLDAIFAAKGADSIGKKRALVHTDPDVAFYEGKIASAKFFALEVLASVKAKCEAIKAGDKTAIEMAIESFAA